MDDLETELLQLLLQPKEDSRSGHVEEVTFPFNNRMDYRTMGNAELLTLVSNRARDCVKSNGISISSEDFFKIVSRICVKLRKEHPINE